MEIKGKVHCFFEQSGTFKNEFIKLGIRLCSEERAMISPDYARNFICDFILGKEQIGTQLAIF
jgi:hypothetical protein